MELEDLERGILHARKTDQVYRFWRRYLAKYYPDVLEKIGVEGLNADEVLAKAVTLLPEEYRPEVTKLN